VAFVGAYGRVAAHHAAGIDKALVAVLTQYLMGKFSNQFTSAAEPKATTQQILVSSNPVGATVVIGGRDSGRTPTTVSTFCGLHPDAVRRVIARIRAMRPSRKSANASPPPLPETATPMLSRQQRIGWPLAIKHNCGDHERSTSG
jgi:hypothetical protein